LLDRTFCIAPHFAIRMVFYVLRFRGNRGAVHGVFSFSFSIPFHFHDVLGYVFRLGRPPQSVLEVDYLRMRALG
jgi:hypothetical protein